jgi:hypothetical protein
MHLVSRIPIDFVAGTHGNYLETVCNRGFGFVDSEAHFTSGGTSHVKSQGYKQSQVFDARHWFELYPQMLVNHNTVISISFTTDDLLLLSSVSLLRAGDANLDNNQLEVNTVTKLDSTHYKNTLALIRESYPFLDATEDNIPRWVLREFYKFGFKDPEINGYWKKLQQMQYQQHQRVFKFEFSWFYDTKKFEAGLQQLSEFLGRSFEFNDVFYQTHNRFLNFIPYTQNKQQCDDIVSAVQSRTEMPVPELNMFQESYINACLENLFGKEMPFYQENYFKNTKDVLYYIEHVAPIL